MNGIKEITNPKECDHTYPITLLWADDKGERFITQARWPSSLKEFLKDKNIAEVGALFFLGQRSSVNTVEALKMFCND